MAGANVNQGDGAVITANGRFVISNREYDPKYADGSYEYGVLFEADYYANNAKAYKGYVWMQTGVDLPADAYGKAFFIDGIGPHWTYLSESAQADYNNLFNPSATSVFYDNPTTTASVQSRAFSAEATLLGIGTNGQLTPLGTFYWNYSSSGSHVTLGTWYFSPSPSSGQQILINYDNVNYKF